MEGIFDQAIESFAGGRLEDLAAAEKSELTQFYEENFLEDSFDPVSNQYVYTTEMLCSELAGRFKMWIDDHFSIDGLLEADEEESGEEEDEEEDDFELDKDQDTDEGENPEKGNDSATPKK